MRNDKRVISIFILMVTAFYHCTFNGHQGWNEQNGAPGVLSPTDRYVWQQLVAEAEWKPAQVAISSLKMAT
jgi:hypothetical protein